MGVVSQLVALLDAMPNAGRGLLGGLLLLLLLILFDYWVARGANKVSLSDGSVDATEPTRLERLRSSFRGYRWRIAHTKSALLALLLVPLLIAVAVSSRMPVFVEALPSTAAVSLQWLNLLVILWLLVAAVLLGLRLWHWRRQPHSIWQAPQGLLAWARTRPWTREAESIQQPIPYAAAPEKLSKRAQHWQRRLGDHRRLSVRVGRTALPRNSNWPVRQIDLPNASLHWPASATDVALIGQLCHLSLKHQSWLRFASLVGCLYWPFGFVRCTLSECLLADFETAAGELARSCYGDPLGFKRAEKQLHDRLGIERQAEVPVVSDQRTLADDPYGRVFLTFAQLLLLVYVLTGTTLREIPDDSNFRYSEFVHDWYETFQRSIKYQSDDQQAKPSP